MGRRLGAARAESLRARLADWTPPSATAPVAPWEMVRNRPDLRGTIRSGSLIGHPDDEVSRSVQANTSKTPSESDRAVGSHLRRSNRLETSTMKTLHLGTGSRNASANDGQMHPPALRGENIGVQPLSSWQRRSRDSRIVGNGAATVWDISRRRMPASKSSPLQPAFTGAQSRSSVRQSSTSGQGSDSNGKI